ncbi:MAG: hypothetical protein ACPG5P_05020, partial [Saprospiraceae bacterium]
LNSYMANSPSGNSSRGYRRLLQDKLFQKEALSEINEFYRLSSDQFDSMNTEFISSYIDVAFLSLQAIGFVEEETDIVEIHVSSCIEGQGTKEVEHLLNIYVRYFEHYEIQYDYNKVTQKITAESHSLLELLKGEEGLHLYYRPHQTPLPIRLEIKHKDYKTSRKGMRVTRLYDSKGTLTDLKSGFSNDYQIRPEEFHLILFAGLNEDLRERLMR